MSKTKFSSRLGFVLSAAGSAVGLGNIWRFPYLAAEYGGGIFLIVYIAVTLIFGFPIMAMEIAIGRRAAKASIASYKELGKGGGTLGWLAAAVTLITLPYYCVIGGWVLKYAITFASGYGRALGVEGFYDTYISKTAEPIVYQVLFLFAATLIVMLGVRSGIEKANRVFMPALVVLALILAVYCLTLDGAIDGLVFYLKPDFEKFSFRTILAATGQMFYSMSLASGIIVTFGAYMERSSDISKSVKQVELFDVGIAFVSGLIVICSTFALSGGEMAMTAGTGLMFEAMPRVFGEMPFGQIAGIVFFVLVLFAALSSAISMMEVNVANLMERFHFRRQTAALIMAGVLFVLGIPSTLGYGLWEHIRPFGRTILDFLDTAGNSVLSPIVALLTCLYVGWVLKPSVLSEEIEKSGTFKRRRSFEFIIKYLAPVFIAAVLIGSALGV